MPTGPRQCSIEPIGAETISGEVLVSGSWSAEHPLTWQGTALTEEPTVAAVVIRQPGVTCWAKARPSTTHELKLLLHPLDFEGARVQPIFYLGTGFLTQSIECVIEQTGPPTIEPSLSIAISETEPRKLAKLSDRPSTSLYLLFFPKSAVKIARNHIWRPKPFLLDSLSEPFRSAMAAGRAGRLAE